MYSFNQKKLVVVVLGFLIAACSGSQKADDTVAGPVGTQKSASESESSTTTMPEVLPEFADATRPSMNLPEHSDYDNSVDAVIETYLNVVRAELYAFGAPEVDPKYEPWLELTTGIYQEKTLERMEEWRSKNWVQILPEDTSTLTNNPIPRGGSFGETEGQIIGLDDCYVDTTTVVDSTTGELIKEDPITFAYVVEMTFTDGRWKVSSLGTKETYKGVSECPES